MIIIKHTLEWEQTTRTLSKDNEPWEEQVEQEHWVHGESSSIWRHHCFDKVDRSYKQVEKEKE